MLYHGSPVGGLSMLTPELSEHGTPYVYMASDPLVALLYAVKPVPKPFSYYPYGFDENGRLVYSEYFKDAFRILYAGKKGYLYECEDVLNAERPTQIACAYTSAQPVRIKRVTAIADLYEYYMAQEAKGMFVIRRFEDVPSATLAHIHRTLKQEIDLYDLREHPEMKRFLQRYFPHILASS